MTTTPMHCATLADQRAAVAALRGCLAQLRAAHVDALTAADHLTGARAARAGELADKAADALAHCERLIVCVTGDLRAEQAQEVTR